MERCRRLKIAVRRLAPQDMDSVKNDSDQHYDNGCGSEPGRQLTFLFCVRHNLKIAFHFTWHTGRMLRFLEGLLWFVMQAQN